MTEQRELMLTDSERQHWLTVHAHLAEQIAAGHGWLSFEGFMETALYAPGLGYYSAGAQKFGTDGDFTTAPEVSSLFGACLARQCMQVLHAVDGATILEIGAGSGRLAADVLARLETFAGLPERYWILEISADLRERQQRYLAQRLPHLVHRVHWLDEPPQAPFKGVIVANEVLDALPVARFRWHPQHVEEMGVTLADGELVWRAQPATEAITGIVQRLAAAGGPWDDGYASEYCPRLAAWTRSVTEALRAGAVLWCDYGLPRSQYYFPQRHEGTLMCHFRQRAHSDPLLYPGLQDITAWVDFTSLAEAALAAGFKVGGFTTQAFFLAGLGIDEEMHIAAAHDDQLFARLAHQARRLMMPGEMGERFKVMVWTRGLDAPLKGFALQDLRHTLA